MNGTNGAKQEEKQTQVIDYLENYLTHNDRQMIFNKVGGFKVNIGSV